MNILTLTSSYPRWPGDYAGLFVSELTDALRMRGHQVTVVAPHSAAMKQDAVSDVHWVTYAPRPFMKLFYGAGAPENIIGNPWLLSLAPFAGIALYRCINNLITDDTILFSHWLFPAALLGGLFYKRVRRHVIMVHSTDLALLEHLPFKQHLATWFEKHSHTIVFASQNLHQRFLACRHKDTNIAPDHSIGSPRLVTIPMGVWNRNYQGITMDSPMPPLRLLFVGRLVPIKGVETLLQAVNPSDPVHITIVGDGPLGTHLQNIARQRNLQVDFKGRLNSVEVSRELMRTHALVVPSLHLPSGRTEGAPRVIMEALSAGLPVVASHCGGIPAMIPPAARHLLFTPGDISQLRLIIQRLVNNPQLMVKLGQESREFSKQFDWKVIAPHFEKALGD